MDKDVRRARYLEHPRSSWRAIECVAERGEILRVRQRRVRARVVLCDNDEGRRPQKVGSGGLDSRRVEDYSRLQPIADKSSTS